MKNEKARSPVLMDTEQMTEHLEAEKNEIVSAKRGRKWYPDVAKNAREETLQETIKNNVSQLLISSNRKSVDLNDIDEVKQRTMEYFESCHNAKTYPSIAGLSAYGFGLSRQRVNDFLRTHPSSESALFIELTKSTIADILTDSALKRSADSVSVIFQLKNGFGFTDRMEIEPVINDPLGPKADAKMLKEKYSDFPD